MIQLAENSGFCFGVKRAIKLALDSTETYPGAVTLGPIIHNPQMVEKLEQEGINCVNSLEEIQGRPVIIRSHGISKHEMELLEAQRIQIIDATCPYVAKTHEIAQMVNKEGYVTVILGNKDHPEVIGLRSYLMGETLVVNSVKELPDKAFRKVSVICQTTQNLESLQELVQKLVSQNIEVRVFNTICNATNIRQESTRKLAMESDVMIIIGGKNSSNTKMLARLSENYTKTYHIETAEAIEKEWFIGHEHIGISAGASTPDWIIIEVYNKIKNIVNLDQPDVLTVDEIPGYKEEANGS